MDVPLTVRSRTPGGRERSSRLSSVRALVVWRDGLHEAEKREPRETEKREPHETAKLEPCATIWRSSTNVSVGR